MRICDKIEAKRVELLSKKIDLDNYVYVITPREYRDLCECTGVDYPSNTLFLWQGMKISVLEDNE